MNHGIHRIHGMVLLTFAVLGTSLAVFAADPTITVSARQRYPWNGLVDLHFTITGTSGTKYDTSFTAKDMVGGTNITMRTICKADGTAASSKEQLLPGTYNWVWDAVADLPKDFKCDRVTVTGTAVEPVHLYMVIDLSSGSSSSSYPVSYLDAVPSGGWSDTYKTTKLVLRRVPAGTFRMGGSKSTTISKPFYIGVFEITQRQWGLVMGSNPSSVSYGQGNAYPVHYVWYTMIRGSSKGARWPSSSGVDASSFLGKLRARTGVTGLDLPTEAQWEYACRAGTTTTYSYGKNVDERYMWYYNNSVAKYDYHAPHVVGTKLPNPWGLYDMHGNVDEWCLDWYDYVSTLAGGTDPKGPPESAGYSARAIRGGCYNGTADSCTSSYRGGDWPYAAPGSSGDFAVRNHGLRIVKSPAE